MEIPSVTFLNFTFDSAHLLAGSHVHTQFGLVWWRCGRLSFFGVFPMATLLCTYARRQRVEETSESKDLSRTTCKYRRIVKKHMRMIDLARALDVYSIWPMHPQELALQMGMR